MSTVIIIISCNYILSLEVKKVRNILCSYKVRQAQMINILEIKNNILIFDYWNIWKTNRKYELDQKYGKLKSNILYYSKTKCQVRQRWNPS